MIRTKRNPLIRFVYAVLLTAVLASAITAGGALQVYAAVDETVFDSTIESNNWPGWPEGPSISGTTGVLMDADTGVVLYDKGKDLQRYPASITKVMTALLLLENCDLNGQVTMTETGLADAYAGSSNVNPSLGEVFSVGDCLKMILVKSANDVSSQIAEYISGSIPAFADLMNARAAELGAVNTHFTNANGLEDPNHYTTAYDMARITMEALKHQEFVDTIGAMEVMIPATNMSDARYYSTHMDLLMPESGVYYEYCIGGKTGNTDISMSTLVAVAKKDGRTLIGVIMHHPDWGQMSRDMSALFEYGFNNFSNTDMSLGVPLMGGGAALLPNGTDPLDVGIVYQDNGSYIDLIYTYNNQIIGLGALDKTNLEAMQIAHGDIDAPVATVTPEAAEAVSEGEPSEGEASDGGDKTRISKTEDKGSFSLGSKVLILVAIAAALVLVLVIMSIISSYKRSQRRKKKMQRRRELQRHKNED